MIRSKVYCEATFLLATARKMGIAVGVNGNQVVTVSTTRVPLATITALERVLAARRREVIAIIEQEAGGRA